MTRKTKIGLLVGLAFIIVVAILLTDHAASIADPKPAPQADVGDNVRRSVQTPSPVTPVSETPRSPVPTRADFDPPADPGASVQVGPGGHGPPITISQIDHTGQLPPLLPPGRPGDLVTRYPDDLTHAGGTPPGPARPTTLPVTPPRTYVAESGDTVSHIALKLMGGNTKANREALIKANPSLQAEGSIVYLGKTYVIPSPGAAAQIGDVPPIGSRTPAPPTPIPAPFAPPAPANTVLYTVKENDNLWRIAAHELGDGNLWTQIRDMNKDVLKGGETVRVNMRIRLPKPSATASVN